MPSFPIEKGKKLYEKQKTKTSPPIAVNAQVCCTGGKEQSHEWKFCPFCLAEKQQANG